MAITVTGVTKTFTQSEIPYRTTSITPAAYPNAGCQWCRGVTSVTIHNGVCPKVKAIEYYPDGSIKRVEFRDGAP